MKTIKFISRDNNVVTSLRLSDEKYNQIKSESKEDILYRYILDCDRIHAGHEPIFLSRSQICRLLERISCLDYYYSVIL